MAKAIDLVRSGAGTIIHSLVVPLFALIFTIYYAELLMGRLCDGSSILTHVKLPYIPDAFYLQW